MKTRTAGMFAAVAALGSLTFAAPRPAEAQTGILKKHPVASAAVAGIAAHHIAKKTGAARAAKGQKPNFAQRHPVLTGAAAAAATHHVLKK